MHMARNISGPDIVGPEWATVERQYCRDLGFSDSKFRDQVTSGPFNLPATLTPRGHDRTPLHMPSSSKTNPDSAGDRPGLPP